MARRQGNDEENIKTKEINSPKSVVLSRETDSKYKKKKDRAERDERTSSKISIHSQGSASLLLKKTHATDVYLTRPPNA